MNLRFPLLAKILVWLGLNLALLALLFYFVLRVQFALGLDSLLAGVAGQRVEAMSQVLGGILQHRPASEWDEILLESGRRNRVQLHLARMDGTLVAATNVLLPESVLARLAERRGPGEGSGRGQGPPPGKGRRWNAEETDAEAHTLFSIRSRDPSRYWVAVRLPFLREPDVPRPWPLTLLIESNSVHGHGLFFDIRPWIFAGLGALVFSALLWMPLVRGVTRSLSEITRAAEQIAEGRFDTRVNQRRRDEIGRLGLAVNQMAERIAGFVQGQKRFLGDTAHELCSPLARIQMALGILEQRVGPNAAPVLEDLREEVQEMSALINELLSFSRATSGRKDLELSPVELAPLARRVVEREAQARAGDSGHAPVQLEIPENLLALGNPDLLARALGNLLRNSLRYAGANGPIRVQASEQNGSVRLKVMDSGPGVHPDALQKIFDPFYRGDSSRSRETGGTGLGLAIVKTCVEACRGTVCARNLSPSGLEVEMTLPAAPSPSAPAKRTSVR